ncbi:hypothetical protein C8Q80DRAFT_904171 [Daedaleopsis nitida]|nr:hypothetical protein C8Q80DRAFT_904171 [Daedaleopsis nitida]
MSEWDDLRPELMFVLLALVFATLLYGAFVVTYAISTWILLTARRGRDKGWKIWIVFGMNTLLLIFATMHLGIALLQTFEAFIWHDTETITPAIFRFSLKTQVGRPLQIMKFVVYVTEMLMVDSFMIYRLYVVWNWRKYVVAIPILLLLSNTIIGYTLLFFRNNLVLMPTFYILSFLTNAVCTVLIMWRVIRSRSGLSGGSHLSLWAVVEAIVESAAIYSAASLALIISFFVSKNVVYRACLNTFTVLIVCTLLDL